MKMEGFINIELRNIHTDEVEYTSETMENLVLDSAKINRSLFTNVSTSGGGTAFGAAENDYISKQLMAYYSIRVGDVYIPNIDKRSIQHPGNWYICNTLEGSTPLVFSSTYDTITATIVMKLNPPEGVVSSRNLHSVALVDSETTSTAASAYIPKFLSIVSTASPIAQSQTQYAVIQYKIIATLGQKNDWSTEYYTALQTLGANTNAFVTNSSSLSGYSWLGQFTNANNSSYLGYFGSFEGNGKRSGPSENYILHYPKRSLPYSIWNGTNLPNIPNTGSPFFLGSGGLSGPTTTARYWTWDGLEHGTATSTIAQNSLGEIFGAISPSSNATYSAPSYSAARVLPIGSNKTQQYYNKINTATTPFFNAAELASTTATINLDTSNYEANYPEYWRIDFGGSTGGGGTAEYSFQKRKFIGWDGDSFTGAPTATHNMALGGGDRATSGSIPIYSASYNQVAISLGGTEVEWRGPLSKIDNLDTDNRAVNILSFNTQDYNTSLDDHFEMFNKPVMYTPNDSFVWNITLKEIVFISYLNAETLRINEFTQPTFTPSCINQYEYDEVSDTFWIACSNTGLWSVSDPFGTISITNYNLAGLADVTATTENKGYSLALGINQGSFRTVWAIIEGALIKSTDNGSTWAAYDSTSLGGVTFTQSIIEAQWNLSVSMKADKNTDNRLCIIYVKDPEASNIGELSGGNEGSIKCAGTWWSSTNDCTNFYTTGEDWGMYGGYYISTFLNARNWTIPLYGTSATWNTTLAGASKYLSMIKRMVMLKFGCTKANSHWWLNSWRAFHNDVAPAGANSNCQGDYPVEIVFENQVDSSPSIFKQFQPYQDWATNVLGYNNGGNGSASIFAPFGHVGRTVYRGRVVTESVDDDGNAILLCRNDKSYSASNGLFRFKFSDSSLTAIDPTSTNNINEWYIGRGLMIGVDRIKSVGSTFYGFDPAFNMISEIWDRYVWTGSAWRLRTSDADPLTLKSTHGTTDTLIGGATISFDDAAASQQYISGESITAAVCDGILNDKAVEWETYFTWKSQYDSELVSEVTGAVIAQNSPGMLVPWFNTNSPYVNATDSVSIYQTGDYYSKTEGDFVYSAGFISAGADDWGNGASGAFRITGVGANGGFTISADGSPYLRLQVNEDNAGTSSQATVSEATKFKSVRGTVATAVSGDFILHSQPYNTNSTLEPTSGNNINQVAIYNVLDAASPPTEGSATELAWGLIDSSTLTDAASPTSLNTPVDSFSSLKYGFKLKCSEHSLTHFGFPYQSHTYRGQAATIATETNYSLYGLIPYHGVPVTIEIIELGVVKHTITGESIGSLFTSQEPKFFGMKDDVLETGAGSLSLEPLQMNEAWPLLSAAGMKIKRVGTTLTYEFRGQTVYTSLVSSSENLVLGQTNIWEHIKTDAAGSVTTNSNSGGYEMTSNNSAFYMMHDLQKETGNDYWVRVGTSGSANGSFNTDLLFMQTARRQAFSIKIDGVEADVVTFNDSQSLTAGQVSVYPRSGLIRCAAADVGKTVTVNIPCAYLEQ